MYGKIFESMFTGSMVGKGAPVFAVMSYVIAYQRPHEDYFQVEINPVLLSTILGEPIEGVKAAIELLCSPDPESRTKADEGRRLVKIGSFDYRVVNGRKYHAIKKETERREQNRIRQERFRKKGKSLPTMNQWVKKGEYLDNRAAKSAGES